jgi:cell division inhibitor SepF
MSIFKRAMDYLGLGPDDAYDDYDLDPAEDDRQARPARSSNYEQAPVTRAPRPSSRQQGAGYEDQPSQVQTVQPQRTMPSRDMDPVPSRPRQAPPDDSNVSPRPVRQGSTVRVAPAPPGEPYTVRPRQFNQAQEVADKFKEGLPVIMNLESSDRETSRRLIDFASGLCYALNGSMEKVATGVYLLKPVAHRAPAQSDQRDYDY